MPIDVLRLIVSYTRGRFFCGAVKQDTDCNSSCPLSRRLFDLHRSVIGRTPSLHCGTLEKKINMIEQCNLERRCPSVVVCVRMREDDEREQASGCASCAWVYTDERVCFAHVVCILTYISFYDMNYLYYICFYLNEL